MNAKQILGTITIVVIIGGTIYAIKKSKDAEKSAEDDITLDEARAIVERGRQHDTHTPIDNDVKEYVNPGIVSDVRPYTTNDIEFDEGDEEDDIMEEDLKAEAREEDSYNASFGITYDGEGDEELRHEPNSMDARDQFIRMELSEWRPLEDTHQTMVKLFDFPFQPKNDGDAILRTIIIDYRVKFFGFNSKWSKEVSIADIILHYARVAEFNCGESIKYWVEYFLEFNELDFTIPSHSIDETLELLNNHAYFNEERQTFGLFGLTRESMDQAIRIANRNIDRSVTYDIEFNEFLKSCL